MVSRLMYRDLKFQKEKKITKNKTFEKDKSIEVLSQAIK